LQLESSLTIYGVKRKVSTVKSINNAIKMSNRKTTESQTPL